MELVLHNLDLLTEILFCLPAESLVEFRSVCKEWLSLISSAEFGRKHTLKLQQSLIIIPAGPRQWFQLNPSSRRVTSFSVSLPDPDDDVEPRILQSSNGLLLLRPYCSPSECNHVYVHNPATKQSRKIALPCRSATHPYVEEVALAFDPSKSPYYQLVCVRCSSYYDEVTRDSRQIEVYSSESHTWDRDRDPSFVGIPHRMFCVSPMVYWNNAIYWGLEREFLYSCFDLAKREMETIPYPGGTARLDYKIYESRLQESNGHLFHVEFVGEGGPGSVLVWELDDEHRWLFRYHHALPPRLQPQYWNRLCILAFLVDTCSLVIRWNERIGFYRLKSRSYEDFVDATENTSIKLNYSHRDYCSFIALESEGTSLALV